MQKIAKSKGGRCLSTEYVNAHSKLSWQCSKGHIWEATPNDAKRKSWCPECNRGRPGANIKLTIEEMRLLAANKGGKCLSDNYINSSTKLEWQCNKGHIWKASPSDIKQGSWCPKCSGVAKSTIEDMRKIAEKWGGQCLSTEYSSNKTKLVWCCLEGHVWEATANNIKNGSWCPYCSGRARLTIEDMKTLATKNGGECLSTEYINTSTKLRWRCSEGHEWESTPNTVEQGSWCPYCANNRKLSIEKMHEIAKSRGGKCLSSKYVNSQTKLTWCCANGHIWEAKPNLIQRGAWCPHCANMKFLNEEKTRFIFESLFGVKFPKRKRYIFKKYELDGYNDQLKVAFEYQGEQHYNPKSWVFKYSNFEEQLSRDKAKREFCKDTGITLIEIPFNAFNSDNELIHFIVQQLTKLDLTVNPDIVNMRLFYSKHSSVLKELSEYADSKGGKCLTTTYINANTNLLWECSEGHQWEASPNNVKNKGQWCPACANRKPLGIEQMKIIAESRGGQCLSDKYINSQTKLRWCCSEGHEWEAIPSNVARGHWCPYCAGKTKGSLEEVQRLAASKRGNCLSDSYINKKTKLTWQCSEGHTWNAIPEMIKGGHWCPVCAGNAKGTIKEMKDLATSRGGYCLSDTYINTDTKLTWQCALGHIWQATPYRIKKGAWCPKCKQ